MDLTFQVPMQHCTLQHQILLLPLDTSTTGQCFHLGSVSLFFLELFLPSCPVAYWAPTDLGSSSFSVISFCPFILPRVLCWGPASAGSRDTLRMDGVGERETEAASQSFLGLSVYFKLMIFINSQVIYTHSYSLLQEKDTKQNQNKEKAHGTKSQRNQVQVSKSPLSMKSHRMC